MKFIEHELSGGADSLRIAERPTPSVGDHEVLIRVAYAGVNRPDVLQRKGLYNPPPDACPYLGLEVSGTIAEVGKSVSRWSVGDRVCALTHGGGYAEFCVADGGHCLPVPDSLNMAQAAALPETYTTVWANLLANRAFESGDSILIHGGTSGIGITAIQLVKHFGGTVFTTVGSADKASFCRDLGADTVINYREADFNKVIDEATTGRGVDVVLDMVGGKYVEKNLTALALEGTLVQISFLEGSRLEIDLAPIMLKRLTFTGSTLRARSPQAKAALIAALEANVWPILLNQRCLPQIHEVYPLAEASSAHKLMESSQHVGKILLRVSG
ncbi:NAD(P)H-quinone oxidoreductase [Herbaspirillum sp. GCM10030257]|uniref:NAD(P)H-quinone oxidoreductase n=1 Tax=Herbaspirillum sp. GCM10030257 TaxID=3273393 RepID=UPI003611030C